MDDERFKGNPNSKHRLCYLPGDKKEIFAGVIPDIYNPCAGKVVVSNTTGDVPRLRAFTIVLACEHRCCVDQ